MTDPREDMTKRLLSESGIGPGMRVLDVGCGRGAVSLLAAELVGPAGTVLGVDRDEVQLAIARAQLREHEIQHVSFEQADFSALTPDHGVFDAAIGRRVLMYQPDVVAAIRTLATQVRPGGLMVFEEIDTTMVPASHVPHPLHDRVYRWMWQTVEAEGGDPTLGFQLAPVFEKAGLIVEHVRAEAIVQTPTTSHPLAIIMRAILPRILERGVATAAEIDIDTLEERLTAERQRANAIYIGDMVFGICARKPT